MSPRESCGKSIIPNSGDSGYQFVTWTRCGLLKLGHVDVVMFSDSSAFLKRIQPRQRAAQNQGVDLVGALVRVN